MAVERGIRVTVEFPDGTSASKVMLPRWEPADRYACNEEFKTAEEATYCFVDTVSSMLRDSFGQWMSDVLFEKFEQIDRETKKS